MKRPNAILALLFALVLTGACAKSSGGMSARAFDDATITTRVKTVFINDLVVGIQKIDVETSNGVVTLSGRVQTKDIEQKAIELAKSVKGVTDVQSKLVIGQ